MVVRTIIGWFKDLFYDSTNTHLDVGRCVAWLSLVSLVAAAAWNMHMDKEIHLSEFGTGLAAVLTALVVYIWHDRKQNGS